MKITGASQTYWQYIFNPVGGNFKCAKLWVIEYGSSKEVGLSSKVSGARLLIYSELLLKRGCEFSEYSFL